MPIAKAFGAGKGLRARAELVIKESRLMLGKKYGVIVLLTLGLLFIVWFAFGDGLAGGGGSKNFVKAVVLSADLEISNKFGPQKRAKMYRCV